MAAYSKRGAILMRDSGCSLQVVHIDVNSRKINFWEFTSFKTVVSMFDVQVTYG